MQKLSIEIFTLTALLHLLLSALVCLIAAFFDEHKLIRYVWLFCVFWVSSVYSARFMLNIYFHKTIRTEFVISVILIVITAELLGFGRKAAIFGFGVGLTFLFAMLFASCTPFLDKKITLILCSMRKNKRGHK